ncbi:cbb3-type cytochrome oxidase assembly protein CcoS [Afifella sp. JA880]|uniref:cbb3-type cytochrome oxidase assembly protein CcoS n=1 Tax=Afifella sp. JA880 TaxID=2975280 RepID=UPI0021BB641F|nr:cbb3-type cytochrome oxidase assembly protein CcoS [Afifella sp. JA880]MCT8267937.1 cbb3-type cytochrome oxidase assembly protein CcoS [Afifella sp. JA880]
MTILVILIPAALFLGALGLAAFLWSLKSGQYDDLDGAAARILLDDEPADGGRRKEVREEEDAAQHV